MPRSSTTGVPTGRARVVAVATAGVVALGVAGGVALLGDDGPTSTRAASTTPPPTPSPTASSASPSPSPSATPSTAPRARSAEEPTVRRLRAADRHALSVAATRSAFRGERTAPVVYLVADDALDLGWAAIPAAATRGGAVLLVPGDRLPAGTAAELERLDPEEVVVVGDTGAVSARVATAAAKVAPVTRIDADDPTVVSRALARAAFPAAATAWVAAADRGTDLAVAAAAAASRRVPLLVLPEDARSLAAADTALLTDLGVREARVVGGTGAVSARVESALTTALGKGSVERASADDRSTLAARVHALAWGGSTAAAAYVANGDRSTDGFTAAFLAGRAGAPLYWTAVHCLPEPSREGVLADTVSRVTVLGGERSVRSLVDDLTACRSTEDPSSLWVLVNKRNGLSPRGFVPDDLEVVPMEHSGGHRLRAAAADALAAMARGSREAGAGTVGIDTAFRSFETQDALYEKWLARRGRAWTDRWYLRPGFSEHQTGLTVDLLPIGRSNCSINDCIDETPQGVWLATNSWRYGFILRYERGSTSTTGVGFEPWHFRYVGKDVARAYHEGGWHTYEDFLGRPAAPGY